MVGSNWPKPHYTLLVTGLCRFQILQVLKEKPYPVAEVEQLDRLEQFTNQHKSEEELGELSEQFYKYAVQVNCLILFIFNQCIDTRFVAFFFLFFFLFVCFSLFVPLTFFSESRISVLLEKYCLWLEISVLSLRVSMQFISG